MSRPRRIGRAIGHLVRGALVACGLVAACASTTTPVSVDPRVETEVARGRGRVLVEVRIPGGVTPEGALPPERAAAQREAIARGQDEVLSRLRGTEFTLVRRFESTPLLALDIGVAALARLRTMGDVVTRVIADDAIPPAGGSTPGP